MSSRATINQMLEDAVSQTGPVPRLAGMIHKNGLLTCYLHGAERFTWNPETDGITLFPPYVLQGNMVISPDEIDVRLCRQLYTRAGGTKVKRMKPDDAVKAELGITKKHLKDKDRRAIEEYKRQMARK